MSVTSYCFFMCCPFGCLFASSCNTHCDTECVTIFLNNLFHRLAVGLWITCRGLYKPPFKLVIGFGIGDPRAPEPMSPAMRASSRTAPLPAFCGGTSHKNNPNPIAQVGVLLETYRYFPYLNFVKVFAEHFCFLFRLTLTDVPIEDYPLCTVQWKRG